jgi:hypothetical protein
MALAEQGEWHEGSLKWDEVLYCGLNLPVLAGCPNLEAGLAKSHAVFSRMMTLLANLDRRHLITPEGAEIVADHVRIRHAAPVLLGAA